MAIGHWCISPTPPPGLFRRLFSKLPGKQFGKLLRRLSGEESGELPGLLFCRLLGRLCGGELDELSGKLRGLLFRGVLGRMPDEAS